MFLRTPADAPKFDAALKAVGVESTFVPVPDKGHGIHGPELEQQADDFFDKHLKSGSSASAPVLAK